jgi:zinc transport system permease protein
MIEPFQQPFMLRAFAAAILSGITLPLIGSFLVPKKLSLLGDASSHFTFAALAVAALAGLGLFMLPYIIPVLAVYGILKTMRVLKLSGDQALAIFLTLGAATASVALSLGARINLNAVLFGSLLLVQPEDLLASLVVALFVAGFITARFGSAVLYVVNEELARVKGVPTGLYELFFAVFAGLSIALGVKIAGVLLVTSLLVIPPTASSAIATSMKKSLALAVAVGLSSLIAGTYASYYVGLAPGALTVAILLALLTAIAAMARAGLRI